MHRRSRARALPSTAARRRARFTDRLGRGPEASIPAAERGTLIIITVEWGDEPSVDRGSAREREAFVMSNAVEKRGMRMPIGDKDWLALTPEAPLEPEIPICDPHH